MDAATIEQEVARLFPDEEAKKAAADEASLARVGALVVAAQDHASTATQVTELVGDLARVDSNRERLGAVEGLLERLVANLKSAQDVPLQKFTARALGNLSYEHEANIDKIIAAGAIPRLIELMRSEDIDVRRNSTGALANLASAADHKEEIVGLGVVPVVYDVLRSTNNEDVQHMAGRVIVNLAESEKNQEEMVRLGGLNLLVEFLVKNEFESITLEAIEALTAILEKPTYIDAFIKVGGLKALITLLADDSENIQVAAGALMYALASQEPLKKRFIPDGVLTRLLEMSHSDDAATRKNSVKILSQLVLNDDIANSVFDDKGHLMALLDVDDLEILISATMIIGNIARSDDHCIRLVDAGVAKSLAKIVRHKDTRLQQLAAGALRNLSLPLENKRKVADSGVFPGLIACLSSQSAHAMFAAIGAIKTLLLYRDNRPLFVGEEGIPALVRIKDAIIIDATQPAEENEAAKKPKDLRIQYEAARTLALLTDEEYTHNQIVALQGVGLLNFLFESPFDTLHTEGLRALKNLTHKEEHTAQLVKDGLLDSLLHYVTWAKNEEVLLGLLGLLSSLAGNEQYREQLKAKNADAALANVTDSAVLTQASSNLRDKISGTPN